MYEANDYIGAIEKYSSMQDVLEDIYRLKVTDYTNVGEARLIKYKKEVKCQCFTSFLYNAFFLP